MHITRREAIQGGTALALASLLPLEALAAAAGGKPIVNKIMLKDGRVWIAASIGDKGPFLFVIDTGGYVSFIDDAFAKQMGLKSIGSRQSVGIGGVSDMTWYNAGTVTLTTSGTRFPDMMFAGLRAPPSRGAVGTFGAGLFTSYDSDLDFVAGEWRAWPDGKPDFAGLTLLDSRFTKESGGASILAKASVDGFAGTFTLDTGAPGEVSLDGPAAKASGLWDDKRPYAPAMSYGIGNGKIPSRLVRADRLTLGAFTFDKPLVMLRKPGSISGSGNSGLIGLGVLGRLNLSTDVSKQQVWASENHLRPEPSRYPLSGLWLDKDRGDVTVSDVGFGSPAAAAGLKIGDVVVGELPELLRAINGGPGKQVVLTVDRGGAKSEVKYTLAEWF